MAAGGNNNNKLERLLAVSSPLQYDPDGLHNNNNNSNNVSLSSALSLSQLVAVHQVLLNAMDTSTSPTNGAEGPGRQNPASSSNDSTHSRRPHGSIPDMVTSVMSKEEDVAAQETCLGILLGPNNNEESEALLTCQYLLHEHGRNNQHANVLEATLSGIQTVTLVLLLQQSSTAANNNATTQDDSGGVTPVLWRPNVITGILEASFSVPPPQQHDPNKDHPDETQTVHVDVKQHCNSLLQSCVTQCVTAVEQMLLVSSSSSFHTTASNVRRGVETASRILVRLLDLATTTTATTDEHNNAPHVLDHWIVCEGMHRVVVLVLHAICYHPHHWVPLLQVVVNDDDTSTPTATIATNDGSTKDGEESMDSRWQHYPSMGHVSLLRPITGLLLPKLHDNLQSTMDDANHSDATDQLFQYILDLASPPSRNLVTKRCHNWEDVAPTVASAILCTVLPSIVSCPLPSNSGTTMTRVRPAQNPLVWDFLSRCLGRGSEAWDGDLANGKGGFARGGGSKDDVDNDTSPEAVNQILRRRGVHFLQILMTGEMSLVQKKKNQDDDDPVVQKAQLERIATWKKYALCFEALEMETESHLVDQIWDTVAELFAVCMPSSSTNDATTDALQMPPMSWDWMSSLLARVLISGSPTVRKLGVYRFLSEGAGISMSFAAPESQTEPNEGADGIYMKKKSSKKRGLQSGKGKQKRLAPMSLISPSFVLGVLLPGYDSLSQSVGTNIQVEENGKKKSADLTLLLQSFLGNYLRVLGTNSTDYSNDQLQDFVSTVLSTNVICKRRTKTVVFLFKVLADVVSLHPMELPIGTDQLENTIQSVHQLFASGTVVLSYRQSLLTSFAALLSCSARVTKIDPMLILRVLVFYPYTGGEEEKLSGQDSLRKWLLMMGPSPSWGTNAGSACTSAYVTGVLLPFVESNDGDNVQGTELERDIGRALVSLCFLAGAIGSDEDSGLSSSEMLWPAIHRGLQSIPMVDSAVPMVPNQKVFRSLILLEHGCQLQLLSGLGNGDLVVDHKTQQMLRPPPNIEALLQKAVLVLLSQMKQLTLLRGRTNQDIGGGASRSNASKNMSVRFTILISQLQTLHHSYPSSVVISDSMNELLVSSLAVLTGRNTDAPRDGQMDLLKQITLVYAALSSGATLDSSNNESLLMDCNDLLDIKFSLPVDFFMMKDNEQAARSIFQYAKWGALSHLVPMAMSQSGADKGYTKQHHELLDKVFERAIDAVHATPTNALLGLFNCAVGAAGHWVDAMQNENDASYVKRMNKLISALFSIMEDTIHGATKMTMLNDICALLFQPRLLAKEYAYWKEDNEADTPVRDAFQALIKMAGVKRPHISRCVVSRICPSWLDSSQQESSQSKNGNTAVTTNCGLTAIPYRDDIVKLLIYKEQRMDESSAYQDDTSNRDKQGQLEDSRTTSAKNPLNFEIELPKETNDLSMVRGFIFLFLSKLPNLEELSTAVRTELLEYIILKLLNDICQCSKIIKNGMLVTGSIDYCQKIRGWQALCLLSRFVTSDISQRVSELVFKAMEQQLHGQIRYFVELFSIQLATNFAVDFGDLFVREIRRRDLSIQHVSSLMIIGGNLIVGRYQIDYFRAMPDEDTAESRARLLKVLSGVLPWLGSTQGFSRAIAQLLVHKLIPLVIHIEDTSDDVESKITGTDDGWVLRTVFDFLEGNTEMARLRKKQMHFFNNYEVDKVLTAEALLSIPVDEGDEANPVHLVEVMKKCLADVYLESHQGDAPSWKRVEEMIKLVDIETGDREDAVSDEKLVVDDAKLINFQRKIIPLDSLNLAIEDMEDQKKRNAAGKKKQGLIVCASLVDKIPNLAGLARTAEIFAADRLVVPDIGVAKMDNFKSISVGAGEWINIEECKEEVRANILSTSDVSHVVVPSPLDVIDCLCIKSL
eukprot:scaffold14942_cov47-Attheya_sp.AAC.1